jgi:ribosome-binding factor A
MAKPRRRSSANKSASTRTYARTDRVNELLREIVAETLERIDDERLGLLTITSVDVDREFEKARVYFTTLGDDDDPLTLEALEEQRGKVRQAIGRESRLRRTPEVVFVHDDTQRSAERIEKILRDLGPVPDTPVEPSPAVDNGADGSTDDRAEPSPEMVDGADGPG